MSGLWVDARVSRVVSWRCSHGSGLQRAYSIFRRISRLFVFVDGTCSSSRAWADTRKIQRAAFVDILSSAFGFRNSKKPAVLSIQHPISLIFLPANSANKRRKFSLFICADSRISRANSSMKSGRVAQFLPVISRRCLPCEAARPLLQIPRRCLRRKRGASGRRP